VRLIRVAAPVPALGALTYALPDNLPVPALGARALVPLGTRVVTGVVVDTTDREGVTGPDEPGITTPAFPAPGAAPADLKSVIDILDENGFLPEDVISLTAWVAEYYACGLGEAIGAAMPPRAWVESERHAQITEAGHGRLLLERGQRRDVLEALKEDRPIRVGSLIGARRGIHAALVSLERDGLIAITRPLVGSASAFRTVRIAHLTAQGFDLHGNFERRSAEAESVPPADGLPKGMTLGSRQREALALLAAAPGGLETPALQDRGIPAAALKRLGALGLVSFSRRRIERDPSGHAVSSERPTRPGDLTLTPEQDRALRRLLELTARNQFSATVLHGVTGSGKTEVYLRLAGAAARAGKGVLVLVPEIALTPAVAAAFRSTFGERVAIQHSGLSDGERHDQWHRIRRSEVDVVVGTRSAVFAPVARLGLIVVDEEHDSSYKQEESPRYNGRDVAVMRARQSGALVVLGSATPSLESYHNAANGRYELIAIEKRVRERPLAAVRLVDMRAEYAANGPDTIVSGVLADAIRERLARREQAMVLLNRRGFATTVLCRQCGSTLECPNCSVTLTVHRAARRARCHYCNYAVRTPTACAHCAGPYLEQIGFGTERVEAEVKALFPEARVARLDRDTTNRRGAITALLERFASREIDVLVGTQMIAKGHDFPEVTLVGVVSADVGLGLADFRAAERTFQLLTQVAGRAGRGDAAGQAIIQTVHPDHYSIRHACRQDYRAFYEEEIAFRRALRYPPAVAMINAIVRAGSADGALADAGEIAGALRTEQSPYRVLGPAPAPLSKIKGEHRAQFFLKGRHRGVMRTALLTALDARPEIKRRTVVDVDPMSVL
jgi:primosomal protein N' (replication factor Y)